MKVLVTEQLPGGAVDVAAPLAAAGHIVTHCHLPNDGAPGGCLAQVPGARCPLASGDIDVFVDARSDAGPMTAREFGVACALRGGTPVVIAGPVPEQDRWPWNEADVQCAPGDVVAACHRALSPTGPAAHRAVAEAARRVLRQAKAPLQPSIELRSKRGAVDVLVTTDRALSPATREAVRSAARASLAAYTPLWQYAQVYFKP